MVDGRPRERTGVGTLDHASVVRPMPGEKVSGDTVVVLPIPNGIFAAIVDVLGHGPEAHELTLQIDAYLKRHGGRDVTDSIVGLHKHLKGSRGAAAGLCVFDASTGRVDYAGTGNTVLRRFGARDTRLVSQDGILGHGMRTPLPQTLELEPDDLVILHTDGITSRFSGADYPGLAHHSPMEVARNIVQRFGKQHDDAACIAVRYSIRSQATGSGEA